MALCAQTYLCWMTNFCDQHIWCCCTFQYRKPCNIENIQISWNWARTYSRLGCSVLNKDRVENTRCHDKATYKLRRRIIRHNKAAHKLRWQIIHGNWNWKADEIEGVEGKLYCPGTAKWIFQCWKTDVFSFWVLLFWCFNLLNRYIIYIHIYINIYIYIFQNFFCSIGIDCVHDLGFSCQLGNFLRNSKAFHVSKGFTLFSKG